MIDSHCHLTDTQFADDLDAVLDRARAAGLNGMVTIASNASDAVSAHALATTFPDVWSTAGVHPHAVGMAVPGDREDIRALLERPRVVALGETGLDYFYDTSPRPVQQEWFAWHLEQSALTGLPVVVHSREAEADTAALIREADRRATGVLHCFAAGDVLFDMAMELDWYLSFGGIVTFRNYTGADFLRRVPADRLLLETDSPYLAPVPRRGKRNEPSLMAHTCAAVAALRDVDATDLARQTEENARRFYKLGSANAVPSSHSSAPQDG